MNHDIAHCSGIFRDGRECPARHECHRYLATQDPDMPDLGTTWLFPDSCKENNFNMQWYENQWIKK